MRRLAPQVAEVARWRRWRDELTIAVALALLACGFALGGWAWRLDRLVYDLGLSLWTRPAPPGIVIVAIDEVSVEAIGRWPWRRAVHATLLERLAKARPRAVALDLVLSEPDPDPGQDRLLAAALMRAAPVVLPVAWRIGGTEPLALLEPTPLFREVTRQGQAEAAVDADGVLRVGFLHAGPPGALYPHLALALLTAGGEALAPRLRAEPAVKAAGWQRRGPVLVRYVGPPGSVARVSYVDVLSGAVPPDRLAGQYVLIGMTAYGLGDTLATPVNAHHEAMPGIEVLANMLYTLRSGDTVEAVGEGQVAAWSSVGLALLLFTFGLLGPRGALPMALTSVPLVLAASLLALRGGVWFSPVPYAMAALLAYPLWSWRRLERAAAGLDREIARLASESKNIAPAPKTQSARGVDAIAARLRVLQRAGAAMRQARRFLADTLAAMPTAMLVADDAARIVLANPKAAALFDVESSDDMSGLDLERLLAEFTTPAGFDWRSGIAGLRAAGQGIAVEARLGEGGDFVVHVAAVELEGQRRIIVTIADVEPVKQAQREREEVLGFVSHDLRSPASSILLLAELSLQGREPMPHEALLAEIRRLALRTLDMSEDFVRAAKVQSWPLARAPALPQAVVEDALADLRTQADAAGTVLQVQTVNNEVAVDIDRPLVTRAIANLVSNAIKHSAAGDVVEVWAEVDAGALRVRVRDHGRGLEPDQLRQIEHGDQGAAVRDTRGVGLGLLFVQRVARRHGGTLRAANAEDGAGAVFELELPPPSAIP